MEKSIWTCDTVTDRLGGLFTACTEESHQDVENKARQDIETGEFSFTTLLDF